MNSPRKRTRLFVDGPVQGAIIRKLILQMLSTAEKQSLTEHMATLWSKYGVLAVVVVTLFPVFIYDSIRLSHRFSGPMVTFRDALQRLSNGEKVNPLTFRSTDFWRDIAGNLNSVSRQLGLLIEPHQATTGDSDAK